MDDEGELAGVFEMPREKRRTGLIPNAYRPTDLFPTDTSIGFHALRTHSRACDAPVQVETTHGAMAQALVSATKNTVRVDARMRRADACFFTWNGTNWDQSPGDIGLDAVRMFAERWDARDVGATEAERRIQPVKYVSADPAVAEHRATVTAMGGRVSQDQDGNAQFLDGTGQRIEFLPEVDDKWIMNANNSARVASLFRADPRIRVPVATPGAGASDWDDDPMLLGTPTGYLDLETQAFSPPSPEMLITKMTNARWAGLDAPCPKWDAFMEQVQPDEEQRRYLQRALGMALLGEVRENAIFCLTGTGANGKSVFTEVISHVLGDYVVAFDAKHLTAGRGEADGGAAAPHLMPLRGARISISSEVPAGKAWDVERMKAWSGGDRITARPLYGDEITFQVSHTMFITSNGTPSIPPDNAAFWRRYRGVDFPSRFATKESEMIGATAVADPTLTRQLKAEADGILAWILRGYQEYMRMGLADPPSVLEATEAAKRASAPWTAFVSECIALTGNVNDEIEVGKLFGIWQVYRETETTFEGSRPNGARHVAAALRGELPAVGYVSGKSGGRARSRVTGVEFTALGHEFEAEYAKKRRAADFLPN